MAKRDTGQPLVRGFQHILLTANYEKYGTYDKVLMSECGYKYTDLIKRDQRLLKRLLLTKFAHISRKSQLHLLVNPKHGLGHRTDASFRVAQTDLNDYDNLIDQGWVVVGRFDIIVQWFAYFEPKQVPEHLLRMENLMDR